MGKFIVLIAETCNFEIHVDAADESDAHEKALEIWRDAPEVGGYQIPDTETAVMAITSVSKPHK